MPYYKFDRSAVIPYGYCHCGCGEKPNLARQTETARGYKKGEPLRYISGHATRGHTISDIFWQHVTKEDADKCWLFRGTLWPHGYGQMKYRRKKYFAHRVSYEIHYGPLARDQRVLHKCDVPQCCNPNHLFAGTQADNVADMIQKGRNRVGEAHPNAKTSAAEVIKMRELASSGMTVSEISKLLGTKRTQVSDIVSRRRWKHLP